ncbi:MAG: hypothetical protein SFX72_07160 [Isosphaeraceae bacterium]|nr:hypothetical protein [Isosphaeraceae bacterium]
MPTTPRAALLRRASTLFGLAAAFAASAGSTSKADLLGLTGNVEADFHESRPDVQIIRDRLDDVAQPGWMNSRGWTSGFNIKDLRLSYDSSADRLLVGLNFVGIAGDADGNGDAGGADPLLAGSHGRDAPSLGGTESIVVAFAARNLDGSMGAPALIAGISENKSLISSTGLAGFTAARYLDRGRGLSTSFGDAVAGLSATLAFDPSAAHPDFEFSIDGLSRAMGLDPTGGLYIRAFAGSREDTVIGEDAIYWTAVGPFGAPLAPLASPPPTRNDPPSDSAAVPEPSARVLVALGLAGVVSWVLVRGSRRASLESRLGADSVGFES